MPGRWVHAGDLRIGDTLLLNDGRYAAVEGVSHGQINGHVCNFEVEDLHCYAVGSVGILVHNNSGGEIARSGGFNHLWIKHDIYNQLQGQGGKADFNKFLAALKKGLVGPTGESGVKKLLTSIGKYTHELKIGRSSQRLLGYIDQNGVLIFDKFVRRVLHL